MHFLWRGCWNCDRMGGDDNMNKTKNKQQVSVFAFFTLSASDTGAGANATAYTTILSPNQTWSVRLHLLLLLVQAKEHSFTVTLLAQLPYFSVLRISHPAYTARTIQSHSLHFTPNAPFILHELLRFLLPNNITY